MTPATDNPVDHAALAAAMTWFVGDTITREDLIVAAINDDRAPRGEFLFTQARITLNAARIDMGGYTRGDDLTAWAGTHPIAMGVLMHEAGHAEHTPRSRICDPRVRIWVDLLEEPRIEAAMRDRHPHARTWLAASAATALTVREAFSTADAAQTFVLAYGRHAAGIFDQDQIADVLSAPRRTLPQWAVTELEHVITSAVWLADDDTAGISAAATTIADIVEEATTAAGERPPHPNPTPDTGPGDTQSPTQTTAEPPRVDDADDTTVPDAGDPANTKDSGRSRIISQHNSFRRPPHPHEVREAHQIGSTLAGHAASTCIPIAKPSPRPPGRIRMRELVRAAAQQELGLPATALPWTRHEHRITPTQPFEVGIIVDRSDSMHLYFDAVAGLAWMLERSMTSAQAGRVCAWAFSDTSEVLPVGNVNEVVVPAGGATSTGLPDALRDYQLWTDHHGNHQRVLVIISDGQFDSVRSPIADICSAGTRVLWWAPTTRALTHSMRAHATTDVVGLSMDSAPLSATTVQDALLR